MSHAPEKAQLESANCAAPEFASLRFQYPGSKIGGKQGKMDHLMNLLLFSGRQGRIEELREMKHRTE
jgi:hypothetical protein